MHGGSFFKTGLANLVPFRIVSQHHGTRWCWPHPARLINYWSTQTSHSEVIWECDSQVSLASSLLKQHPCGKQTQQTDPAAVTTLSAPGWGPFESCRALWRNFSQQRGSQVNPASSPFGHSHPTPLELRTEPRTFCLLIKHSTTELGLQPLPSVAFVTLYLRCSNLVKL